MIALAYTALLTLMLLQSSSNPYIGPAAPPGPPDPVRELLLTIAHIIGFALLVTLWWKAFAPSSRPLFMAVLIALTLGAEGAVLLEDGEEVARAEPPPVEAVDGTAAGDAFTACLLVSLLEGRDREEALVRACAAGAIAASRFGAQPSLPTAAEIEEILAR